VCSAGLSRHMAGVRQLSAWGTGTRLRLPLIAVPEREMIHGHVVYRVLVFIPRAAAFGWCGLE